MKTKPKKTCVGCAYFAACGDVSRAEPCKGKKLSQSKRKKIRDMKNDIYKPQSMGFDYDCWTPSRSLFVYFLGVLVAVRTGFFDIPVLLVLAYIVIFSVLQLWFENKFYEYVDCD